MKRNNGATVAASRSPEQWAVIVDEWRQSKQTPRDFCNDRGVNHKSFQWWRWALRMREAGSRVRSPPRRKNLKVCGPGAAASTSPAPTPAFIELVHQEASRVKQTHHSSGVEIVLLGVHRERRVKIDADFDEATLRRVVSLLEEV